VLIETNDGHAVCRHIADGGESLQPEIAVLIHVEDRYVRNSAVSVEMGENIFLELGVWP
jgi:hypothetical protein